MLYRRATAYVIIYTTITDFYHAVYIAESEKKSKGVSGFERHLQNLVIRHILARVSRPQTNGKLERIHGELQRKSSLFEDVAGPPDSACLFNPPSIKKDPIARFMKWYNHDRQHMYMDMTIEWTPAMAFKRKMPRLRLNLPMNDRHFIMTGSCTKHSVSLVCHD